MLSDDEIRAVLPWLVYAALVIEGHKIQEKRRQTGRRGISAPPANKQKLSLAKSKALLHHRKR